MPSGLIATPGGVLPMAKVAVTWLVVVSMTDTLREKVGDVGAGAVGADRHPGGSLPTVMVAVTWLVAVSITDTLPGHSSLAT